MSVAELRQGLLGVGPQNGRRTTGSAPSSAPSPAVSSQSIQSEGISSPSASGENPTSKRLLSVLLNLWQSLKTVAVELLQSRTETVSISQLRKGTLAIGPQPGELAPVKAAEKTLRKARKKTQEEEASGEEPVAAASAVSANFTLLADPAPRHRAFAASIVVQCLGVALLAALPLLLPEELNPFHRYEVVPLLAPPTTLPLEPPKFVAKAQPPSEHFQKPKPKLLAPPKHVFDEMKFDTPRPARPRQAVRTGGLEAVSFAAPTIHKSAEKVQTGGFGDPYGAAGASNTNKRANIAQKGSFGLPNGAGFGNGLGGANGTPGTVAGGGGGHPDTEPVEILSKPHPVYTDEARRIRLEGEVLLQVVFRASGKVQVQRVVRGLGHGLDEAAIRAAEQIQFHPARRHGAPVDFPAVIHIVFQMAY